MSGKERSGLNMHDINDTLYPFERELTGEAADLKYPAVLIIGAPRSGTTLLYQMLSTYYDFFYPTNLIAKFYKCPAVFLKAVSGIDLFTYSSGFKSSLGNTDGIFEPHEWGWFWDFYLNENPGLLKNELCAVQTRCPNPMLFKNIYFIYKLKELSDILGKKAVFVFTQRPVYDNAKSVLNAMNSGGSVIGSKYLKPHYAKIKNSAECAVLQVLYDIRLIEVFKNSGICGIDVCYGNLCLNPENELERIAEEYKKITGETLHRKCGFDAGLVKNAEEKALNPELAEFVEKYENHSKEELEKILFGENNEHP